MREVNISDIIYHLEKCMKEQGNIKFKIQLEIDSQLKDIEIDSVSYENNGIFQINCSIEK